MSDVEGHVEPIVSFATDSMGCGASISAVGDAAAPLEASKLSTGPLVTTTPVKVVDNESLTINEYFGRVASKDSTASLAVVDVRKAGSVSFQTRGFAEYVICNSGAIDLEYADGGCSRVNAGEGALLHAGLRVKSSFSGACNYTAVCVPAFLPEHSGFEHGDQIVDDDAQTKLKSLHSSEPAAP